MNRRARLRGLRTSRGNGRKYTTGEAAMPIRRSILLLLSAGVLCTSVALAQDNETMRKQFRQLGVPEAEIDRMLKGLDDKLKESGASEAERGAIMSQRQRGVKAPARWRRGVKRQEDETASA